MEGEVLSHPAAPHRSCHLLTPVPPDGFTPRRRLAPSHYGSMPLSRWAER